MDQSQMSNGEYSSDGGGPASPPILPPSFTRFGLHGAYDSLPQTQFMLQPPSLHALQKLQIENLQKMQELDNAALMQHKIQTEFDASDFPSQLPPEIPDKYPELILKAPELIQKFPDLLQKIPNELLVKNPEFLKFLNLNLGKNADAGNDANSSAESVDNDSVPIDLSNDKSDGKTASNSGLFGDFEYEKIAEGSPLENSGDEIWCRYLRPFGANETCIDGSTCEDAAKDHFHCVADGCNVIFRYGPLRLLR